MFILGLDVGGTKIELQLYDFKVPETQEIQQKLLAKKRIPTQRESGGYEAILQRISQLIFDLLQEQNLNLSQIKGIGLSLPGTISLTDQNYKMLNGNTLALVGKPILPDLTSLLKVSVPLVPENDANCFALAEHYFGAGREFIKKTRIPLSECISVGIILGTGVGGGLISQNKIFRGNLGGAAEIGHSRFMFPGHPCYCGREGCAEQYLSGPAIEATYHTRSANGSKSGQEIFNLSANQDPIALAVVEQYKGYLVDFLANLRNLYDPHFFVLGGGVSNQKIIYEKVLDKVVSTSFLKENGGLEVYQNRLGDSGGALGAALLAYQKLIVE